jgi:hypothetical protein
MPIHRWLGSTSTDVYTPANWSTGEIPVTDDTVIFDSLAQNSCTGNLTAILDHIIAKPEFGHTLGTSADSPLFIQGSNVDLRSPGTNYLSFGFQEPNLSVYGGGSHTITGGSVTDLSVLGSLADFDHPAFTGSLVIQGDVGITGKVEVSGNAAGSITINNNSTTALATCNVDGRGVTVSIQRSVTNLNLEGGPPGFTNTVILAPEDALTNYANLSIQGRESDDAVVDVTTSAVIGSLRMDNGLITFVNNMSSDGASITSAELYGSAVIDLRNNLQNITLTNVKVMSQDADIRMSNNTIVSVSY